MPGRQKQQTIPGSRGVVVAVSSAAAVVSLTLALFGANPTSSILIRPGDAATTAAAAATTTTATSLLSHDNSGSRRPRRHLIPIFVQSERAALTSTTNNDEDEGDDLAGTTGSSSSGSSSSSSLPLPLPLPPPSSVYFDPQTMSSPSSSSSSSSSNPSYPHTDASSSNGALTPLATHEQQRQHHSKHKKVFDPDHPPLWPPTTSTLWGLFLALLSLVVAAGGGIGGGGLLVPIFILVMQFNPKHAIPLSNVTVFGGAIANTYLNLKKRHPTPGVDRPLVDWDLILVMEPLTIAGALIGAFLNKVLPELALTLALVLLLGFTSYTTFQKAGSLRRKETAALVLRGYKADGTKQSELTKLVAKLAAQQQDDEEEAEDETEGEGDDGATDDDIPELEGNRGGVGDPETQPLAMTTTVATPTVSTPDEEEKEKARQLREILEYERHTPVVNLQILGALFAVVLIINIMKGGGAFKSPIGITCGSALFWAANITMLVWIVLITLLVRSYLVQRNRAKLACNYPFAEGDIQWDERATLVYPLVCCLAGLCAGMFGIGGGIVKGPLMLAMGVHPAVSSASSACMILFTSFTATTSYMVFGLLVPDYALACLLLGFVATFAGQLGIQAVMERTGNRYSYIAYSVAIVVLLSACLMTIQSLLSAAEGERHHSGGICGKGD